MAGCCGFRKVKMGKVLAKADGTSQGRIGNATKEFVSPTKEVRRDGTSDRGEIARPDSRFFGETLFGGGQSCGTICGGDALWHSGGGVSAFERGSPFPGGEDLG